MGICREDCHYPSQRCHVSGLVLQLCRIGKLFCQHPLRDRLTLSNSRPKYKPEYFRKRIITTIITKGSRELTNISCHWDTSLSQHALSTEPLWNECCQCVPLLLPFSVLHFWPTLSLSKGHIHPLGKPVPCIGSSPVLLWSVNLSPFLRSLGVFLYLWISPLC